MKCARFIATDTHTQPHTHNQHVEIDVLQKYLFSQPSTKRLINRTFHCSHNANDDVDVDVDVNKWRTIRLLCKKCNKRIIVHSSLLLNCAQHCVIFPFLFAMCHLAISLPVSAHFLYCSDLATLTHARSVINWQLLVIRRHFVCNWNDLLEWKSIVKCGTRVLPWTNTKQNKTRQNKSKNRSSKRSVNMNKRPENRIYWNRIRCERENLIK